MCLLSSLDPVCCCALNPKTPPPSSAPADPSPRPSPTLVPLLDVRSVSADLGGRQQVSTRFLLSREIRPCYPLKVTISSVTGSVCVTSWENKKRHIRNSGFTWLSDLITVDKKLFILKICRVTLTFHSAAVSHGLREENKHAEEEMDSEKEEEDSEEEMESGITRPVLVLGGGGPAQECAAPSLTKAEARKLRRVKRADYSWLAALHHSWTCTETLTNTATSDGSSAVCCCFIMCLDEWWWSPSFIAPDSYSVVFFFSCGSGCMSAVVLKE